VKRNALPVLLRELAVHLRAAKYTPDALAERLGIRVPDDIGPLNHAAAIERLRDDTSAAGALTRLFFLEADESPGHVFDVPTQRAMRAAGLLHIHGRRIAGGRRITPRLRLDPIGNQWLLSDLRFRLPDARALGLPAGDPVYPPSSDSLLLRDVVVCPDANRVLDLCTGSGVQALSVAARCQHVVAVDVSARAAAMTRANADLNRVINIEVRVGDLYRPLADERFDLVMANPPFVPSPYRRGPAYHSGGPTGARVLKRIVANLADVLQPAGRFFAVSHLALRDRETAAGVVRPWFGTFPGRALALVLERGSAIDLAAAQALFALNDGLAAYAAEVHRWVAYLRRHRVCEVILVLLVAERSGRHRAVEVIEALQRTLPLPLSHPPRHHVEQWFATLIHR
jgi:carbamoyltransferase